MNLSARPEVLLLFLRTNIDGSRTIARERRRDGLGTFACAAAFNRITASAALARAQRRIQPTGAALSADAISPLAVTATAFDRAWTSLPEQP